MMPTKLKFRTGYTARDEEHKGIVFTSDSLCQQHFKDECDVNVIVDRYVKTGELSHLADVPPHFGDVSEVPTDLIAAYAQVEAAEAAFMDLPSQLRKELGNDPSRLSEWLLNPDNKAAAVRFGLLNETVQPESTFVEPKVRSETTTESPKTPENQGV